MSAGPKPEYGIQINNEESLVYVVHDILVELKERIQRGLHLLNAKTQRICSNNQHLSSLLNGCRGNTGNLMFPFHGEPHVNN